MGQWYIANHNIRSGVFPSIHKLKCDFAPLKIYATYNPIVGFDHVRNVVDSGGSPRGTAHHPTRSDRSARSFQEHPIESR